MKNECNINIKDEKIDFNFDSNIHFYGVFLYYYLLG